MKTLKLFAIARVLVGTTTNSFAQSVDEILTNFFENTGGLDNWKALKGIKMEGKIDVQGMEIPLEIIQLSNGKTMVKGNFQGQVFYQNVFDGETLWGTNQMTMTAEKSDAEATENYKNELNDFPDPFIDYKSKGYTVELVGKETIEGTEAYKVKLIKEPLKVDGKEVQDITFYFFDTENYVPIVVEKEVTQGPAAGMIGQTKLSDYKEVDGLYLPHSIAEGAKGMPGGQTITMTKITFNPEVDESIFTFPESTATEKKE